MVWNHIYGTRCLLLVVVVSLSNREEQQASTHTNAWGPTSELKSSVLLHPRIAVHCAARSAIVSFLLANYLGLPLRLIERERTCEFVRMGVGLTTYTMSPSRLTVCSWLSSKVEVDSRPSIKVEDDSRLSSKVEVESSRDCRFDVISPSIFSPHHYCQLHSRSHPSGYISQIGSDQSFEPDRDQRKGQDVPSRPVRALLPAPFGVKRFMGTRLRASELA